MENFESKEKPGHFVGFAENTGDAMTHLVLTEDKKTVLACNVVRAANDPESRNGKVKFEDDVEKEIEQIDAEPENFKHSKPLQPADDDDDGGEDNQEMNEPSITSDDHDQEDQGIASRTRSRKRIVGTLNIKALEDKRVNKNDPETLKLMKISTMIFFTLSQLSLWVPMKTRSSQVTSVSMISSRRPSNMET